MSGHSKWNSIRHKKGSADAKRGKIFTKHAKLIGIAAREGGDSDPEMNSQLKTAIENAKVDNVPNTNIERAIKKGTGELKGAQTEAVMYAGLGPKNVALLIEGLTDNKNRTLSNLKVIIGRKGGKWAELSSVQWMFEQKGVVVACVQDGTKSEELELELIDAGAEDIEYSNNILTVTTAADNWPKVRDFLKKQGFNIEEAGLKYVAKQEVLLTEQEAAQKLMELVEAIEEDDDVTDVYTNADIAEGLL